MHKFVGYLEVIIFLHINSSLVRMRKEMLQIKNRWQKIE